MNEAHDLREADRRSVITKLASSLAHAIGTPLNVVSGHAQLISSGSLAGSEVTASAATIAEQAERIDELLTTLMSYAQPRPLAPESLDAREVVEHALALLGPRSERVELEVAPAGTAVLDASRVIQALTAVLHEMLANAGGPISLGVSELDIEDPPERRARPGRYLCLDIIHPDFALAGAARGDELFKPFFTGESERGAGLALAVAHGVAREHHGWIAVEREAGGGTRVQLFFPSGSNDET